MWSNFLISTLISCFSPNDQGKGINFSSIILQVRLSSIPFEMLSFVSLAVVVSVAQAGFSSPWILSTYPNLEACVGLPLQYSCENTTVLTNSCCNVVQGGLVLQTQYWDTYTGLENLGQLLPTGSWGIHGLWPDNCDGLFIFLIEFIIPDELPS
jgi:hypothetical protein